MASNALIGLLVGLGFGAWVYGKLYRSTGGNTKNALIAAAASGLLTFLLIITVLGKIF